MHNIKTIKMLGALSLATILAAGLLPDFPALANDITLADNVYGTASAFLDANFLLAVYDSLDKDGDEPLLISEVAEITALNVSYREIA